VEPVTTGQIYWGSVPFIVIQLIMVAAVMLFPGIVMHYKAGVTTVDPSTVTIDVGTNYGGGVYGGAGADPAAAFK
ncbi:C4-dicarboxylate ABC transporter, partial [Bordetella petrii]|nr:C4-dicarboxylate ABC transporter [Bordetella petrii]